MDIIFRDLITKCWWSWFGLFLFIILTLALIISPALNNVEQGIVALLAYAALCLFFAKPVWAAARARPIHHLLTVCAWTFFLVLLGIAATFYAFYSIAGDNYSSYDKLLNVVPVFVAIWAAAVGWFIHFRLTTKAHRTNNAFSIIMEMRKSAEFLKRQETIAEHFPPGHGSSAIDDSYKNYFSGGSVKAIKEAATHEKPVDQGALEKAQAVQSLKYMLNYFEFMAVGIEAGDLDEELLYDTICTTVVDVYDRSSKLLDYLRADAPQGSGQHLAFIDLAPLVSRWRARIDQDTVTVKATQRNRG